MEGYKRRDLSGGIRAEGSKRLDLSRGYQVEGSDRSVMSGWVPRFQVKGSEWRDPCGWIQADGSELRYPSGGI